jgi:hypothetical protein
VQKNRSAGMTVLSFPFASTVVIRVLRLNGIQSPSRKMGRIRRLCHLVSSESQGYDARNIMAMHLPQVLCHQSLK